MDNLRDLDVGVREGDVLAGKYRVERVLGAGGMGVVVAAHHIQLDEKVALKFLLPESLKNLECVARFEREARAAVKVKNEHVARVIDVGKLENGSPYMVMEYLEGGDLSGWIEKQGKLPFEQAVDFVLQAAEALAEAHALGIVHRDLKPANLFCIRRPNGQLSIKVLDFGISKMNASDPTSSMQMTRTTAVVGSPVYMSPEQMQSSKGVDARTDIWSLGIILFELVTGRIPFDGQTVTEIAIRIATETPPAVSSLRPDVPPGLEQAILRCLEKDRGRRFQNVGELAVGLAEFGSRHAHGSLERIQGTLRTAELSVEPSQFAVLPSARPQAQPSSTAASWQSGSRAGGVSKTVVGSVSAAGVVALLVAGIVFLRSPPAAPPPSPASGAVAVSSPPPPTPAPPPAASVALLPIAEIVASAPTTPAPPPAVSPKSVPRPVAAPRPAAHPAAAAALAPAAPAPAVTPPKVSCEPPYYYDGNGTRVFKKECL